MSASVPFPGDLGETPLTDVLESLRLRRATGTLIVSSNSVEKSVYMEDGQIIFASSTDVQDRLGEMLIKAGKLTRPQLETALTLHKRSGGLKKLGALLVENGFLSPKDLFVGFKTQVNEILYSLFLLKVGTYRFEENLPADIIHLQINIEELIAGIIRRIKQEA